MLVIGGFIGKSEPGTSLKEKDYTGVHGTIAK